MKFQMIHSVHVAADMAIAFRASSTLLSVEIMHRCYAGFGPHLLCFRRT